MPIEIHDSSSLKDKEGLLGKALLVSDALTRVYTASKVTKSTRANINVLNSSNAPNTVTIWISDKDTPSAVDLYESALSIMPNATYYRSNLVLAAKESVFVKSSGDGCVVRVEGYEDNPQ